jgi:hypothetical protein
VRVKSAGELSSFEFAPAVFTPETMGGLGSRTAPAVAAADFRNARRSKGAMTLLDVFWVFAVAIYRRLGTEGDEVTAREIPPYA